MLKEYGSYVDSLTFSTVSKYELIKFSALTVGRQFVLCSILVFGSNQPTLQILGLSVLQLWYTCILVSSRRYENSSD